MNSKTSKTQVFINLESDNIPLQPLCSLYLASDSQRRGNLNKKGERVSVSFAIKRRALRTFDSLTVLSKDG